MQIIKIGDNWSLLETGNLIATKDLNAGMYNRQVSVIKVLPLLSDIERGELVKHLRRRG